jgi:hypothetical protein
MKVKFLMFLGFLFILGLLAAVAAGYLLTSGKQIGQTFFGRGFAESQLREYVSTVLKQEINGAQCQPIDTDNNGYVSCDYTTVAEPNRPRSIECTAWGWDGFLKKGCKARTPNFN